MPRRSIAQTLILSCSGVSFDGVGAYAARRFFSTRLFVVLCALLAALPESSTTFASLYGMRARRSHSAVRLTMCARIVVSVRDRALIRLPVTCAMETSARDSRVMATFGIARTIEIGGAHV